MRGLIVVAAVGALVLAPARMYQVTVTGDEGLRLWALPARPGTVVALAYVNSIYLAPTEELFVLTPDGLTLTAVRSTSEAVLAYNGLSAPYRRDGTFIVSPAAGRFRTIVLRVGRTGRPHLRVGGQDLPLYTAGEGARLTIAVGDITRP